MDHISTLKSGDYQRGINEVLSEIKSQLRLFKNLCQSGKITNTQGNIDEDRNRCRAIRS